MNVIESTTLIHLHLAQKNQHFIYLCSFMLEQLFFSLMWNELSNEIEEKDIFVEPGTFFLNWYASKKENKQK